MTNVMGDLNKKIASKLKEIRKQNKYTLEDVGKFLSISPQQLQKYEANITKVPFSKLYMFLERFNISPQEFFESLEQEKDGN